MKPSRSTPVLTIVASIGLAATVVLNFPVALAEGSRPPSWGAASSPSPTAGKDVSDKANAAADRGMYTEVEYANAGTPGPALVVIPGEVKSNNANFVERFLPNNIADFAELELTRANFKVLERTALGPVLNEFVLAYNLGDPESAAKLKKGKLKTTKWIVKFDILKAEQAAAQKKGFKGETLGSLIDLLGGSSRATSAASTVAGSIDTRSTAGVWVIGMRYKIIDANTTEQVAQGYTEEKMEVGSQEGRVAGVESGAAGGVSLDTMVQRLVQKSVWDIDQKYK
jgi:hypothetical protein